MPWQMPIQDAWQIHLLHQRQEHHKVIDALVRYRQFLFHAPQYARKFLFCLAHSANGEELWYYNRNFSYSIQLRSADCVLYDCWNTAQTFKAGHRIGVEISSSAFPKYDRNLNTSAPLGQTVEMAVAEQRIYHDADHPSDIVLPVIP